VVLLSVSYNIHWETFFLQLIHHYLLATCGQVSYIITCILILYDTYLFAMPVVAFYCHSRDNMIITFICCLILSTFMILPTITHNNDVIIQQDDKVYQCVRTYKLPLQAYPLILDPDSSVIGDYRSHGYSCDLSSYGPICPYEQTLEASPNYLKYSRGSRFLDAFVCKQNDPEGVNLCHRYIFVSPD
jgi:hypothetical protein